MRILLNLLNVALLASQCERALPYAHVWRRLNFGGIGSSSSLAATTTTLKTPHASPSTADPKVTLRLATNKVDSDDAKQYEEQSRPKIAKSISEFQDFYSKLSRDVGAFRLVDATKRFLFVSPPPLGRSWSDEDVLARDTDIVSNKNGDRTISQIVADRYGTQKPILLYLPGLDGTGKGCVDNELYLDILLTETSLGISSARFQFDDLSRTFDFWRLTISTDDRSSFEELVRVVCQFVHELADSGDDVRPVHIMGESFGGLLASAVALRLQKREERGEGVNPLKGLVLVNPATSFENSNWDLLSPLLTGLYNSKPRDARYELSDNDLPSAYATVGSLVLSALVPSQTQIRRLVGYFAELSTSDSSGFGFSQTQGLLQETIKSFKNIERRLPGPLVEHRVQKWLMVGSAFMKEERLSQINLPTLIVSGQDDAFLKSADEAKRLQRIMPSCETLLVPKNGHFVMDSSVNITEAIIFSRLDPLKENKPQYDPVMDWKMPPRDEVDEAFQGSVKPLEERFSPIYISTDSNGRRAFGLENLSKKSGPILFVSNHQLLGQDLNLVVPRLVNNGIVVRGLGHPLIFSGSTRSELGGRTPGLRKRPTEPNESAGIKTATNGFSVFQKFGAVVVTPKNYYRLLQSGQNVLLFPGGVREVFHGKDEAYKLFWPKKVDFVRTAARFNATIVPLSAVGMADSFNHLLSSEQIAAAPFVGDAIRQFSNNITAARFDMSPEDEFFTPPLLVPSQPSRNYFVFGKPMSTTDLDPKDKVSCQRAYAAIQDELNRGFRDILLAREKDLFKDSLPRQVYERAFGRQAPTFPIDEMNR